jgi:hypothetical protein
MPQGAVFVGSYLTEPQLLVAGYAYEQATRARVAPDLDATLQLIDNLTTEDTEMATSQKPKTDPARPAYVTDLEAAYGAPSQAGFGSAVFFEKLKAGATQNRFAACSPSRTPCPTGSPRPPMRRIRASPS